MSLARVDDDGMQEPEPRGVRARENGLEGLSVGVSSMRAQSSEKSTSSPHVDVTTRARIIDSTSLDVIICKDAAAELVEPSVPRPQDWRLGSEGGSGPKQQQPRLWCDMRADLAAGTRFPGT